MEGWGRCLSTGFSETLLKEEHAGLWGQELTSLGMFSGSFIPVAGALG